MVAVYFPRATPPGVSKLKTTEVPLTRPPIEALVKHGESVDVMLPESVAVLPPVFGP